MLEGPVVRLVVLESKHLDLIMKRWNDPEMRAFLGPYIPQSRAQEAEWIEGVERRRKNQEAFFFVIERIKDNAFLGTLSVHNIDWIARSARMGIVIHEKKNWGKGYGTEAFGLLIEYCWNHLNLRRLELSVHTFNVRAVHVYEKLGFKLIGTTHQRFYINGEYVDTHHMELLRGVED
jgi:RimJ/RimL family protein N-acetyltransferase